MNGDGPYPAALTYIWRIDIAVQTDLVVEGVSCVKATITRHVFNDNRQSGERICHRFFIVPERDTKPAG